MAKGVLVLGGSIEGVQAALDLANAEMHVYLVERSLALTSQSSAYADAISNPPRLIPKLLAAARYPNIQILTNTAVKGIAGEKGNFRVTLTRYPRYVDVDRCSSCARCERVCPVDILPEDGLVHGSAAHGRKAIASPGPRAVPSTYAISKSGLAPCRHACPGGVNAQGYIALISKGKFAEALSLIREAIPFPGVIGRVCTRPCETACTRREIDEPVAICSLKRFVADQELLSSVPIHSEILPNEASPPLDAGVRGRTASMKGTVFGSSDTLGRIAIVGSGPAGLTAARSLAALGHAVTVFEASSEAGGMMRSCIPAFRLPRNVLDAEIAHAKSFGVDIRTSTPIGPNLTLDDLKAQGFRAILLAVGAHKPRKLNIPGDSLDGVIDCVDLLKAVSSGHPARNIGRAVVVGGGNAAVDAARTLVRLGADEVRILYRRTRKEMPAGEAEIEEAGKEGVIVDYLISPTRVLGHSKVSGIECTRMALTGNVRDGRSQVKPLPGSEFAIEVDSVVTAIGQYPDLGFLSEDYLAQMDRDGTISANEASLATSIPGVFAAGDAVSGPATVIEAIAAGKRAAASIHRFIQGAENWQDLISRDSASAGDHLRPVARPAFAKELLDSSQRERMPALTPESRRGSFVETELGFDASAAIAEARRCLNCGICSECMECVRACELGAIKHDDTATEIELTVEAIVGDGNGSIPALDGIFSIVRAPTLDSQLLSASAAAARAMAIADRPAQSSEQDGSVAAGRSDGNVAAGFSLRGPSSEHVEPISFITKTKLSADCGHTATNRATMPSRNGNKRYGIFLCQCGGQISNTIDLPAIGHAFASLPNVAFVGQLSYACSPTFSEYAKNAMAEGTLDGAVIAACPCCSSEQICAGCSHSRVRCKGQFLGNAQGDFVFEFVNVREQCAWAHLNEPSKATEKTKAMIHTALLRLQGLATSFPRLRPVLPTALVVGAGDAAVECAGNLAAQGFKTVLISSRAVSDATRETIEHAGVEIIEKAEIKAIAGAVGSFEVTVARSGKSKSLLAGVIILDGGALVLKQLATIQNLLGLPDDAAWLRPSADSGIDAPETLVRGVYFCQAGETPDHATTWGLAAAARASALLASRHIRLASNVARVESFRCRGCGDCEKVCGYYAIRVEIAETGTGTAAVDDVLCRGCGNCAAHCRSGAIVMEGCSQTQTRELLAAMLS